ncbi:MAG: aminoacyl-tRNA hydrolase [candidate division WOR-3 bacterium]|nr:aminoacyl-tRNA hydrolase [candidate division WOR-3 bacterium]
MIVFGLGNPLPRYRYTRHNVGFMVVDELSKKLSIRFRHYANYSIAQTNDKSMILIKPMLYMNNSGIVVADYLKDKQMNFIIVCDDIALPLGKIRIREKGSDGGHQGLASIIYHLQTNNFPRMRIGVGKPPAEMSMSDYVLSKFSENEKIILDKTIELACSALIDIEHKGIKSAMSKYNAINVE